MKTLKKAEYLIRDSILRLLSDDEIAKVSTAETKATLLDGDEYIDLEQLHRGVRRALGTTTPMYRVLPKKAVRPQTWKNILIQMAAMGVRTHPSARQS